MLNVVAIMGRLARDPELRQTQSGMAVLSFGVNCARPRPAKTSLLSASLAIADAVTPTARARQTGSMWSRGIARQNSSASISRRVP